MIQRPHWPKSHSDFAFSHDGKKLAVVSYQEAEKPAWDGW